MSGNEVAIQQALMRADAAVRAVNDLGSRVAVLENIVRAATGQAAPPQATAPAAAPAAAPAPAPVVGVPVPSMPVAAPTPNLGAAVAPWLSLLGAVVQSAGADVMPTLRALSQQPGQAPSAFGGLLAALLPPAAPAAPAAPQMPGDGSWRVGVPVHLRGTPPEGGYVPQPLAPAPAVASGQPGPGQPVSAGELDWLAAEGGAAEAGPVVPAQQTSQLPPGYTSMQPAYQQPAGVAPAAGVPVVQMPR